MTGLYIVAVAVALLAFYAFLELVSWAIGFPSVNDMARLVWMNVRLRRVERLHAQTRRDRPIVEHVEESWR